MYKLIILCCILACAHAYTLKYFNCDAHKPTQRYAADSVCAKDETSESNETISYDLLQTLDFAEVPGFSCQLRVTRFFVFCGSFSHNKFEKIPEVDLVESVPVERCRQWVRTKRFKSKDGSSHVLQLGETILSINDLGTIHAKDSVSCEGEDLKINGEVIHQSVVMAQYRVTVLKQTFRIKTSSPVEVLGDHKRLPKSCRPKSGACVTDTETYFWQADISRCPLERLRTLHASKTGDYIVDHHSKLLIKLLGEIPSSRGCPAPSIWKTVYKDIYVAKSSAYKWPEYELSEIYLPAFVRSLADYTLYESERNLRRAILKGKADLCASNLQDASTKYHRLDGDTFATRRGDTIITFQCQQEIGTVYTADRCYIDIPLLDANHQGGTGKVIYIDPISRVKKSISAPTKCSQAFPLEILTEQQVYISLTPAIIRLTPPSKKKSNIGTFHHEDLASVAGDTGIYSNVEVSSHLEHIREQEFTDSVTRSIAYGVMSNTEAYDNDPAFNYDISRLNPEKIIKDLDLLARLDKWLQHYGAYVSLLVLILEATKCIITLSMITYSAVKDGIHGARAICYGLCCSQLVSTTKQLERAKRRRMRSSAQETTEMKCLDPTDQDYE